MEHIRARAKGVSSSPGWVHGLQQLSRCDPERDSANHTDVCFLRAWKALQTAPEAIDETWRGPLLSRTSPSVMATVGAAASDTRHARWSRALALLDAMRVTGPAARLRAFLGQNTPFPAPLSSAVGSTLDYLDVAVSDLTDQDAVRLAGEVSTKAGAEAILSRVLPSRWATALRVAAVIRSRGVPFLDRGAPGLLTQMYLGHPALILTCGSFDLLDSAVHTAVLARAVHPRAASDALRAMAKLGVQLPPEIQRELISRSASDTHFTIPLAVHLGERDWTYLLRSAREPSARHAVLDAFDACFGTGFVTERLSYRGEDETTEPSPRAITSAPLLEALLDAAAEYHGNVPAKLLACVAQMAAAGQLPDQLVAESGKVERSKVIATWLVCAFGPDLPTSVALGCTRHLSEHVGWTPATLGATCLAHARVGRWFKAIDLLQRSAGHGTVRGFAAYDANLIAPVANYMNPAPRELQLRGAVLKAISPLNLHALAVRRVRTAVSVRSLPHMRDVNLLMALCRSPRTMRTLLKAFSDEWAHFSEDALLTAVRHMGTWRIALKAVVAQPTIFLSEDLQHALSTAPAAVLHRAAVFATSAVRPDIAATCNAAAAMRSGDVQRALSLVNYLARVRLLRPYAFSELFRMFAGYELAPPLAKDATIRTRQVVESRHRLNAQRAARIRPDAEGNVPVASQSHLTQQIRPMAPRAPRTYCSLLALTAMRAEGIAVGFRAAQMVLRTAAAEGTWLGAIIALSVEANRTARVSRDSALAAIRAARDSWRGALRIACHPSVFNATQSPLLRRELQLTVHYPSSALVRRGSTTVWKECLELASERRRSSVDLVARLSATTDAPVAFALAALLDLTKETTDVPSPAGGDQETPFWDPKNDATLREASETICRRLVQAGDWGRACALLTSPVALRFEYESSLLALVDVVVRRKPALREGLRQHLKHAHLRARLQQALGTR